MKPAVVPTRDVWEDKAQYYAKNYPAEHIGMRDKWSKNRFLQFMKKFVSRDKVALEIGCGSGRLMEVLAPRFRSIHGVDYAEGMIERARALVKYPNLSFSLNDGMTLEEFPDNCFGVVYAHEIFHILDTLLVYIYLDEIKRVLCPEGIGILSFLNITSCKLIEETRRVREEKRLFSLHNHFVTKEMLEIMLGQLNMEIIDIRSGRWLFIAFREKK